MQKSKNVGTCLLCQGKTDHRSVIKHIGQCLEKYELASIKNKSPLEKEKIFLINISAGKSFWLYIEINGSASLDDLDSFLRDIWLECCGHLSQFIIDGTNYPSDDEMHKTIGNILKIGDKFNYEYDFGSTTELEGKIISVRKGKLKKE